MDGISSALAVVSFSIQLIGIIRKAQTFLKEVRNAPEEVAKLADTLGQLEYLLVTTNDLVEQQNRIVNLSGTVYHIASALQRCQTTMEKLGDTILTINSCPETQNRGRKVWVSLKTAGKKDHIEHLRKQIQEDITSLQTALILNSSHLQLHQLKLLSTQQQPSLSTATCLSIRPELRNTGTSSTKYIVQTRVTNTWLCSSSFGIFKLYKETKFVRTRRNAPEKAIAEEKRLTYIPPFLRIALELRCDTGFFQVPKSLSYCQVISQKIMRQTCDAWNMELFTQKLSQGTFSPFARTQCGRTWLHLAAVSYNPELCSFLIKIGVDPTHTDDGGAKAIHQVCLPRDSQLDTMRALATGQDDISAEDLSSLLDDWFSGSPECVDLLLSTYGYSDETFDADIQDFSLLKIACREYGSGNEGWSTSIRKWLRRKPDLHTRSFVSVDTLRHGVLANLVDRSQALFWHQEMTFTLLDELFALGRDPFEAEFLAQEWLLMLAEAGYDINTYLENEKQLHLNQNFLSYPDYSNWDTDISRQLVFEIGENPKVSWEWWIDPSSHASLVRHEFQNMNLDHMDQNMRSDRFPDYWEEIWPFDYPHWSKNRRPYPVDILERESWEKRANQAARRYNRQAKKYPESFEDIAEGVVIPGTWVEDEF